MASKDVSLLSVRGLTVKDSGIGLAVYQKKAEFGPASLSATGLDISGTPTPFLVEPGSTLNVDARVISAAGSAAELEGVKGVR